VFCAGGAGGWGGMDGQSIHETLHLSRSLQKNVTKEMETVWDNLHFRS